MKSKMVANTFGTLLHTLPPCPKLRTTADCSFVRIVSIFQPATASWIVWRAIYDAVSRLIWNGSWEACPEAEVSMIVHQHWTLLPSIPHLALLDFNALEDDRAFCPYAHLFWKPTH